MQAVAKILVLINYCCDASIQLVLRYAIGCGGSMAETERMRLTVYASSYRINGVGNLLPGVRVTDFMNARDGFLALTNAEVWTQEGRRVLAVPFLNIRRAVIEMVVPRAERKAA
jgi:hypothetical protein